MLKVSIFSDSHSSLLFTNCSSKVYNHCYLCPKEFSNFHTNSHTSTLNHAKALHLGSLLDYKMAPERHQPSSAPGPPGALEHADRICQNTGPGQQGKVGF